MVVKSIPKSIENWRVEIVSHYKIMIEAKY